MISSLTIRNLLLRTEEDAKFSRILNKQRYHRDQLTHADSQHNKSLQYNKTVLNRSYSHGSDNYHSQSSNQQTPDKNQYPRAAWTSQENKILNTPRPNETHHASNNLLQDVSIEDCEVKSNISLLDSESVYLPIDGAKTPVTPKRPMTAPSSDSSNVNSNSVLTFTVRERPQTGFSERKQETRYEAYDRRPIKPLNQSLGRGSKRNFDFSPPQPSGSGPAIGVKKQTPPTAMSQDYDTSIDQNNSDQENIEIDPIPTGGLSIIKDVIGNRKAQALNHHSNSDTNKTKVKLDRSSSLKTSDRVAKPRTNYNADKYLSSLNSTTSSGVQTLLNNKSKDSKKGSTLIATKDSGYSSRPSSDAVLCDTSNIDEQKAATSIQAFWKGHRTRQCNPEVVSVRNEIRARHAEEHIVLLQTELERQKKICEDEKRFRDLQMEAIRSLRQEVQSLQNWKNEILSCHSLGDSQGSTTASNRATLTGTTDSSVTALLGHVEQTNLEETCASLQSQVFQLQETLESLNTQNTASTGMPDFDETDLTSDICVTTNFDNEDDQAETSLTSGRWSSIPHSLSPYPSEEEDQYFRQVPEFGVPTPPRGLKLQHRGDQSLILSWQKSKLLDASGKPQKKNILGYRVYINDHCQAMVRYYKNKVLITGLSSNTIYKFYVKALSGLGESYESNIIMAKLAFTQSKTSLQSSESDSPDSEKDQSSSGRSEQHHRKHNKRRTRKERSPRSPRSQNTSYTSSEAKPPTPENRNESAAALLTQPRLHKHRRTTTRENLPSDPNDKSDNTDSDKRQSTGSERSANISSTSNRTDSSFTSPGRDSSLEQKSTIVESDKPKFFKSLNDNANTGMSETFTVDKSRSFLVSLGRANSSDEGSGKTHRRSSSRERDVKDGFVELRRTHSSDLSPTEKENLDTGKTHRRKRSKDLQNQFSDLISDLSGEQKLADVQSQEGRQLPAGIPIIDGRKRHSSGSRPNSPMLETAESSITTERKRVPVADRFLNINRSSTQGSHDDVPETIPHRQLPPSPKSKGQRSPSPHGSKEDLSSSGRRRTASSGSDDTNNSSTSKQSAKVLQKLQLLSKSHEKKLHNKSKEESVEGVHVKGGGRIRRVSDSDCDQGSDINRRAPVPSDSSGSHSDDTCNQPNRSHYKHRRTPSDQSGVLNFTPNIPVDRPAHSPIIMDGGAVKKSSSSSSSSTSNVKRHSSFHSLLPPKRQDKSASGEDLSKPIEENELTTNKA
ncbi:uncharacterized protein LOC126810978 isoform X2 [Patella vulgata]|uniref:uncharacterized protein LOC126810978 isoform X2 n=1 Tax=Patella vulgata TaxID=6465 RepID=UPI0021805C5F|nr:uncharacterized protein LOC126810978 isoform X2 [Patella vulgata]